MSGNKKNSLTPKQALFCAEYLIDQNATKAAIRAKYSKKTAYSQGQRLLKKAEIQRKLQILQNKRSERTEITADYVLTTIRNTVERCQQAEPFLDREGNPTGEYRFDSTGVLKGCDLLGKHLKLFTEKIEHSGEVLPMRVEVVFAGAKT